MGIRGVEYRNKKIVNIGLKKSNTHEQEKWLISDFLYENCQLSEIGTYMKKKVANIGLSESFFRGSPRRINTFPS